MSKPTKINSTNESGQALLLVLLAMSVVLTIGLSIVSRSITDIANTSRQEESTRAFSAAESGIEKALLIGGPISGGIGSEGSQFTATIVAQQGDNEYSYPATVSSGDTAHLWLVNHDANGNYTCSGNTCFTPTTPLGPLRINFCWGNVGAAGPIPAAEFMVYYAPTAGNYSSVRTWKAGYDPDAARRGSNAFLAPDSGGCTVLGKTYQYQKQISLGSGIGGLGLPTAPHNLLFVKVRLLYNTTPQEVGFSSVTGIFPPQGNIVQSTGTSGAANRKLEVLRLFGEPPSIFSSVIYSESSQTHN